MQSEGAGQMSGGGVWYRVNFFAKSQNTKFSYGFRLVQGRRDSESALFRPSIEPIVFNDFDHADGAHFRDFHLEHRFKALFVTF